VIFEIIEMTLGPVFLAIRRRADFIVGNVHPTAAVRAARGKYVGFVRPKFGRRGYMSMHIDNHFCFSFAPTLIFGQGDTQVEIAARAG
jgi:hypothetical protein